MSNRESRYHAEDNELPMKGSLVKQNDGTRYRIVEMNKNRVGLLNLGTMRIIWAEFEPFIKDCLNGIYVKEPEKQTQSATPTAKEAVKISRLVCAFEWYLEKTYPAWETLFVNGAKNELKEEAIQMAGVKRNWFNMMFRTYMLSGRNQYSLLDQRHFNGYEKRDPSVDEKKKYFPEALREFKAGGPDISVSEVYEQMMDNHYSKPVFDEITGKPRRPEWLPPDQTPSEKQLRTYIESHLGGLTVTEFKNGEREYANNQRPLIGTSDYGFYSIGQAMQIDEQEYDVPVVDTVTRELCTGKVIIYTAIDVVSGCAMGITVGFGNNKYERLAGLLMSMTEPHSRELARYGVDCDDEDFPSCVLPNVIISDRGAEYMSENCKVMCQELAITLNPDRPGGGSWKGLVESNHKRVQNMLDPILKEKKDSYNDQKKYETARKMSVMTIYDMTKSVYMAIQTLNRQKSDSVTITEEMMQAKLFPAPADVYQFLKKKKDPTTVTDKNRQTILFALLRHANVGDNVGFNVDLRRGIVSKDKWLQYTTEEYWFDEVRRAKSSDVDIRYTEDTLDYVFVRFKGVIRRVPLAPKNERMNRFRGKSFAEYKKEKKEYETAIKEEERKRHAERASTKAKIRKIKKKAELLSSGASETDNIREYRHEEQTAFEASENNVAMRLLDETVGGVEEQEAHEVQEAPKTQHVIDMSLPPEDFFKAFEQEERRRNAKGC